MKNTEENKSMTMEEVLQDPSQAHLHAAIRYTLNTPFNVLFPKKHELTMVDLAKERTIELFEENPNMPLNVVLTDVWKQLPNDLSPSLILKVTKKTIEKWESLIVSAHKNVFSD